IFGIPGEHITVHGCSAPGPVAQIVPPAGRPTAVFVTCLEVIAYTCDGTHPRSDNV
ncbi:hypothetical protein ACLOJK_018215, partial [Asimina triloba]